MKVVINSAYGGYSLPDAVIEYCEERGFKPDRYGRNDSARAHPTLVEAIEKLSSDGLSYGDLEIVEIPDGIEFSIYEFDGLEHIAEKGRTWHGRR